MLGKLIIIFTSFMVLIIALLYYQLNNTIEQPEMKDGWWSKEPIPKAENYPDHMKADLKEFVIDFKQQDIDDLNRRLDATKYAQPLLDSKFHYGFNIDYLKVTVDYWRNQYDWKKQQKLLNKYKHYKVNLEGIDVHFVKVMAINAKPNTKTLLLIHGWPGSFWEFYKIIDLLTKTTIKENEETFNIVCPSIPGYGFSESAHRQGFNAVDSARIFRKLMQRLQIDNYYVQGGDWGSLIGSVMAVAYPQNVRGLHLNMGSPSRANKLTFIKHVLSWFVPWAFLDKEDAEKPSLVSKLGHLLKESGYFHLQATKPDTVGASLQDSPAGLAAYILEKFSTWTNPKYTSLTDGGLNIDYSIDELLTNVVIYWMNNCITSSARFYKENMEDADLQFKWANIPVLVPSGFANFANEIIQVTRLGAMTKLSNLVQFSNFKKGGHFAAFQVPNLMAKDVRSFVIKAEEFHRKNKKI